MLAEIIHEAGAAGGASKSQGNMMYSMAGKFPAGALKHRPALLAYVMADKISKVPQIEGAFKYLKTVGDRDLDPGKLEEAAGVGVVVTEADVAAAVAAALEESAARLAEERYFFNTGPLMGKVRGRLKWADSALIMQEFDKQIAARLGPKTEADLVRPKKKKAPKAPKPVAKPKAEAAPEPPADVYAFLPKPEENNVVHTTVNFSDGSVLRVGNTAEKLAAHLRRTGGKVVTRFPPEPNGYLHLGHAKAMFIDFGMAEQYGGDCYLRYDDTNPEAEKQEYIDHIQEIVKWMGWKPFKITYSSDYFQELYEFAVKLIEAGKAYVCHQTGDEISEGRAAQQDSPWRDRPVAESLKLFDDMKKGLVDEGTATLRMKMDMRNKNFNMYDLIAYRIKFVEHPMAGDKWCIYPSYDYTHCLVDALEDITHSLCTLEFETRRASYYWLLDALDTYKPLVWEYGRCNVTNNVMSKRKLNKLVTDGHVHGWDDPRLLTLAGLRRRGFTASALNAFCKDVGIARQNSEIPVHRLEHHIRMDLEQSAPRAMAVLKPLKVVLTNVPDGWSEAFAAKRFPGGDATYPVAMGKEVYVEATDFREKDEKKFFGMAPGKLVMLRYAFVIKCTGFTKDAAGNVTEVAAERVFDYAEKKPPKGILHWVSADAPGLAGALEAEVRIYDKLFKSQSPGELDDWLEDLNPTSLEVVKGALVVPAVGAAAVGDKFQFERTGYFCVDPDTKPGGCVVLNRTCSLREAKF